MANYIALLGAYERDNFGDILFLHVNARLLSPWPVVPLGLVSADMTGESGAHVISTSAWFDVCGEFTPFALVMVGGEILTCDLDSALAFVVSSIQAHNYTKLGHNAKLSLAHGLSWRSGMLPYTDYSGFSTHISKKPFKVAYNSIGGTQLDHGNNLESLVAAKDCLAHADYVSVRDRSTRALCERHLHINPPVFPDVVNTISESCLDLVDGGRQRLDRQIRLQQGNYLLFQASDSYLRNHSTREIATQIRRCAADLHCGIVLQPAGLAYEHDSMESLEALRAALIEDGIAETAVSLQTDRDVWVQVAAIADARCFIGTSLHGRIVASSFATPRVSLENKKVNAYAESWDGAIQPYNVPVERLADAVAEATRTTPGVLTGHAKSMVRLALAGYKNLRDALMIGAEANDIAETEIALERVKRTALHRENQIIRNCAVDLAYQLSLNTQLMRDADYALKSIKKSWSWRMTSPLRLTKRLLKTIG